MSEPKAFLATYGTEKASGRAVTCESALEAMKTKRAALVDGSGYAAQLLVRNDFGCVLEGKRRAAKK